MHKLAGSLYKRHAIRQLAPPSDRLWVYGFRFSFTPLPGFFSPFPHGTASLSVAFAYLALEGGPPSFQQDSTCPAVLRFPAHGAAGMSCTGLSPPLVALSSSVPLCQRFLTPPGVMHPQRQSPTTQPVQLCTHITYRLFGLLPFRSPLLRESLATLCRMAL